MIFSTFFLLKNSGSKKGGTGVKNSRGTKQGIPFFFLLAGILLVAGTLAWEAFHYPWATVFGGPQNDAGLPDPPPIVWKGGDGPADGSASSAPVSSGCLPGGEAPDSALPERYTELGIIKIPRLSLSQHVLEGTQRQLRYGVGHVTGTAPLGGKGNCALAGHDTTSFRYLDRLVKGDRVILKTASGVYTYSVYGSFTVNPEDTWVLNSVGGESHALTLITCNLTGTRRLIVRARLVGAGRS